jgi:uncharacterized iron-regulated membrane protein
MFVTGTAGYGSGAIQRWSQPELGKKSEAVIAARPDQVAMAEAAIGRLRAEMPEAAYHGAVLPTKGGYYFLSADAEPHPPADGSEAAPIDLRIDPVTPKELSGETAARETTGGWGLQALHFQLHYLSLGPTPVGGFQLAAIPTLIVGAATMLMLIAIVTGTVVHRKIFADFFTFRTRKSQRSWLDAHNLSSVLALPFMVMITYSGLIFYMHDYSPVPKTMAYGTGEGAQARFEEELYGPSEIPDPAGVPAEMAPIGPMVAAGMAASPIGSISYIDIYNPGDANAQVLISPTGYDGMSYPHHLTFDGATGALLPAVEAPANPAGAFADVMMTLHAALRPADRAWTEQFGLAALAFLAIPVVNALTTQVHLGQTPFVPAAERDLVLASVDLALLAVGLFFATLAGWRLQRQPRHAPTATLLEPAE